VLGHLDGRVQQVVQLAQRRSGRLQRVEELAQLLHRLEEVREIEHEGGHGAEGDGTAVHHPAAEVDDGGGAHDAGALDHGEVPDRDPHRVHVGVEEFVVAGLEPPGLPLLPGEGLDDPQARQAFLEAREHRADAVAHDEVGGVGEALEPDAGHHHHGQGHEGDQRQLPRHDHQHGQRHDQQQAVAEEQDEADLHELGEGLDVGRHAGHEDAGLLPVEEGHGERLEVGEDAHPQVAEEPLAHQVDDDDQRPVRDVGEGGDDDVGDDRHVERPDVVLPQPVVDAVPDEGGTGHHRGRPQHHEGRAERQGAPRAEVPPRAAQHPLGRRRVELVLLADAAAGEAPAAPHELVPAGSGSPTPRSARLAEARTCR
jgi:hypothetical protein